MHGAAAGTWEVETFAVGGELVPPLEGTRLTLEFDGERVAGSAGVNRFMGRIEDERLFGPVATTMMAGPEEHMAQERLFLGHLESVDNLEYESDEMRLVADGLIVVTLREAETNSPSRNVR